MNAHPAVRRQHVPGAATVLILLTLLLPGAHTARAQAVDFVPFGDVSGFRFVGTAAASDSVIDLNGLGPKLSGAVWYYQKQPIARGFVTSFVFQISDTMGQGDAHGDRGGDGLTFVIQNDEPTPVGGAGGLLGYDGIRNSVAIEFDTYANDEPGFGDPNGNHVSIQTTGTGMNSASHSFSIASNTSIPYLSDGRPHTVTIEYVNGALRVYIDGCQGLLLALPFDFERRIALDNGKAWIGLTGATGSAWERHMIRSWRFNARPLTTPTRVAMCEGFSARLSPPGRFSTYRWSNGATTPSIDVRVPGRYSVEVTDSLGCVPGEFAFVYDVVESRNPRPAIGASDSVRLCAGSRVTLDAGAWTTYLWSTGAATRQIVATTPGLYWVSVADSLGCTGRDSIMVYLAPKPTPQVHIDGSTTFCEGDSVVLDAGAGFASYRWSNGATTRRLVVRSAGSYTVTVTNVEGCPATSTPVAVTVRPRPYPIIDASGPTRLCPGGRVTLDAGEGYSSYRWSNGATSRTIAVDSAGVFTVTVTSANGCSGTSAPVTVSLAAPPAPALIASPASRLCTGDTVTLRTSLPYARYRWSTGETTPSIVVTRSERFWVDVVDSNGCEGRSDTMAIHLDSIGILKIRASGPTDFCEGDSVTLTAPEGLARYRWSTGETTRSIVVRTSGTYVVVGTDSIGCVGADSLDVRVFTQPRLALTADTTICAGTEVALTATGAASYSWLPAEGLSCADCASPVARPLATTTYRVVGMNEGDCSDTAYVTVTVLPAPGLVVRAGEDQRVYPGLTVDVPVSIAGPVAEAAANDFTIELDYDTSVMMLKGITLEGEMLVGWTMETIADSVGRFVARFHSNDGRTLGDGARLLTMRMQTFLGMPLRAEIRPTLRLADAPCATIASAAAAITIDSLCGVGQRLIEQFAEAYALAPAAPNPFASSTALDLSIGLDGPVRLEILGPDGARVALLHDGPLAAGRHRFDWDAAPLPSGMYLARAVAGEWSSTRVLVLVR